MYIARILGPDKYGDFNFLLGSFTSLITLLDMATSSAFYTFISKKKRGAIFFALYGFWLMFQMFFMLSLIKFMPESVKNSIWVGQEDQLVIIAFFASFSMRKLWQFSTQLGESERDNIRIQIRNLTLILFYGLAIVIFGYFEKLSIQGLLVLNGCLYLFFSVAYIVKIFNINLLDNQATEKPKEIFLEFKNFCYPLLPYTIVGFFYSFLDLWLLQIFGGSIEQGYYAVGLRFSSIILIVTTSITQIFWKEISDLIEKKEDLKVAILYEKTSQIFFVTSMILSAFLIANTNEIILVTLGENFEPAIIPTSLMFFYSVHQSWGNLTGTMLLSTENTKMLSKIGIYHMVLSMFFLYFLIAPNSTLIPGLELGSLGVALKMVLGNIVFVNFSAFFVAKILKSNFNWKHQFFCVPILIISLLSKGLSTIFINQFFKGISYSFGFIVSGSIYLVIILIIIMKYPYIVGLKKILLQRISK